MFLRLEPYLGVDFLTFLFIGSFSFHSQLRLRLNVLFLCKEVKILMKLSGTLYIL